MTFSMFTLTACSADFLAWSTCSTLLMSLNSFKGKVATSPMAYTPGILVSKNPSVCHNIIENVKERTVSKETTSLLDMMKRTVEK